ncbi:tryptophan halogenase family protein [Celeribacter sp.]|uniref:tryptophan halogenase family protein n=1 Tax=Celeribacter sp. TaxID=1890673 RepID=UPI003A8D3D49
MAWPAHICIVGGGTAGWLAALMLRDAAERAKAPIRFTVVESSKIGTIGVGEGTTAVFRMMLRHLGIDEMDFLRETGATIKFGIRHRDWRRLGHSYDGPIDDPTQVTGRTGNWLDAYQVGAGKPVADPHLFAHLMAKGKSPYGRRGDKLLPLGPFHHAFHFDQALAGKFLKKQAQGIDIIDDQVIGIETGTAGIERLRFESGAELSADFFIDCTGFKRALIGPLGAKWQSYGDVLPVNRAMPFWLDIPDGEEIDPVTLAWAQKSGWMWRIPTQERYGCGYVYSDAHTTPEEAQREIEAALGHPITPRADIEIDAGRLDRQWIGNTVALGLSSSFLEPLEATSIHGTIVQLMMLAALMGTSEAETRFNAACARQVDDFRDFIRLHYASERRDSAFWCDVAESHPQSVRDLAARAAQKIPGPEDFTPLPMSLPHVGHQLVNPVLDGLGLLSKAAGKATLPATERPKARKTAQELISEYKRAASKAIGHRAFLTHLRQKDPVT